MDISQSKKQSHEKRTEGTGEYLVSYSCALFLYYPLLRCQSGQHARTPCHLWHLRCHVAQQGYHRPSPSPVGLAAVLLPPRSWGNLVVARLDPKLPRLYLGIVAAQQTKAARALGGRKTYYPPALATSHCLGLNRGFL